LGAKQRTDSPPREQRSGRLKAPTIRRALTPAAELLSLCCRQPPALI